MPLSAGCAALPKVLVYVITLYLLLYSLSFYMLRQLVDDSLSRIAEACPLIEHLILSSCLSISINGLSSLHCLHKLSLLDLSYTFLINLKPVFDSCPQLKVSLIVILFRSHLLRILESNQVINKTMETLLKWTCPFFLHLTVILCCLIFIHMCM